MTFTCCCGREFKSFAAMTADGHDPRQCWAARQPGQAAFILSKVITGVGRLERAHEKGEAGHGHTTA